MIVLIPCIELKIFFLSFIHYIITWLNAVQCSFFTLPCCLINLLSIEIIWFDALHMYTSHWITKTIHMTYSFMCKLKPIYPVIACNLSVCNFVAGRTEILPCLQCACNSVWDKLHEMSRENLNEFQRFRRHNDLGVNKASSKQLTYKIRVLLRYLLSSMLYQGPLYIFYFSRLNIWRGIFGGKCI